MDITQQLIDIFQQVDQPTSDVGADEAQDTESVTVSRCPLDVLPSEILLEILKWVTHMSFQHVNIRNKLTSVCSRWRALAIAEPSLWRAVYFRMLHWEKCLKRCFLWMERAGGAGIHLRFDDGQRDKADSEGDEITEQQMGDFLQRVIPFIHQLESIIFLVRNWGPLYTLLKFLDVVRRGGHPLGALTRIELMRTGDTLTGWPSQRAGVPGHEVTYYPFPGAIFPRLNWITVSGVPFDWAPLTTVNDLVCLDLRRLPIQLAPTRQLFRSVLQNSPLLQRLLFDGAGPKGLGSGQDHPVTLNHLRLLLLSNLSPEYVQRVCAELDAPNLGDLQLVCLRGHKPYGDAFAFLAGRYPNVRIFSLLECDILPGSMPGFVRLLASMPKVRMMRLWPHPENPKHGGLEACFAYDAGGTAVLPGVAQLREWFLQASDMWAWPEGWPHIDVETRGRSVLPELLVLEARFTVTQSVIAAAFLRFASGHPLRKMLVWDLQIAQNAGFRRLAQMCGYSLGLMRQGVKSYEETIVQDDRLWKAHFGLA